MKKPLEFEILARLDGTRARTGVIRTAHGEIRTPAMVAAATKATVKTLTNAEIDELGAQAILVNTYHLLLQPGEEVLRAAGGVSGFMNYGRPTFSDSGGFQIMSLPRVKIGDGGVKFRSHIDGREFEMTPESSMRTQHAIGADIHMAFDCPIGYGDTDTARANAEKTLKLTHDWAERCAAEHSRLNEAHVAAGEELQALYGVVQGGEFEDLREQSARFFAEGGWDGYGIGGMYEAEKSRPFMEIVNRILPEGKPRHWLGMGAEPVDFFVGVECGIDTFDCVAPTRQARNGALYTHDGRMNIMNARYRDDLTAVDEECGCYTCRNHTRAYLAHLFRADEATGKVLATIHNEYFVVNLVNEIRESVERGDFAEFRDKWLGRYYDGGRKKA